MFVWDCDLGAFVLHPNCPASPGALLQWMQPGCRGAEGEESVNPVFLGDVTAVFREEENALLCSQGLGEVSPRRMVGMRREAEISCLAWAEKTAAISMPPLVCYPEPALDLKRSLHLAKLWPSFKNHRDLQCGQGWYGQLPDQSLIQPWEAARQPTLPSLSTVCDRALQGAGAAGWHLWASNASGSLRAPCSKHQTAGLCVHPPSQM